MDSALQIRFSTLSVLRPPSLRRSSSFRLVSSPSLLTLQRKTGIFPIKAAGSSGMSVNPSDSKIVCISHIRSTACAVIVAAAAFGKFSVLPVRAIVPPPTSEAVTEDLLKESALPGEELGQCSPMAQLLISNPETTDALKKLIQQKLESGEDEESLSMLRKVASAQPENSEWKFLLARLLNEMGKTQEARAAFEDILAKHPLSFQALFENALLMDRSGERDSVLGRLEEALRVAESENKMKEARDVKLIIAQMLFLQKHVDEALSSYEELVKEDPNDFRPYFCRGIIFTLTDRLALAKEQFAKFRQLCPDEFEVKEFLRTPLSRMDLREDRAT